MKVGYNSAGAHTLRHQVNANGGLPVKTYLLEIYWTSGSKKEYQVTGTFHAGCLLRKFHGAWNSARLHDEYSNGDPCVVSIQPRDYGHLFDRNNTHY